MGILLVGIALVGLPWFRTTLLGAADFADVNRYGERIGPFSAEGSAWFRGLFLIPAGVAVVLALSSLPRSRPARLVAMIGWLLPAAALLIGIPFGIAAEIDNTELQIYADDQTERIVIVVVSYLLIAGLCALIARAAARGRVVGFAMLAAAAGIVGALIHAILLTQLLAATGRDAVSVSIGPWLVLAGLIALSVSAGLLAGSAGGAQRPAAVRAAMATASNVGENGGA